MPRAQDILRQTVVRLTLPLGQNLPVLNFQLENNRIAFLKGYVEVGGVKNLTEFLLDGPQHFILVQP